MKLKKKIVGAYAFLMCFSANVAFAADIDQLDPNGNKIFKGSNKIMNDLYTLAQWAVRAGAVVAFLWALAKHLRSNDPGDKKDARNWMIGIVVAYVFGEIAIWFFKDYLKGAFS